MNGEPSETEGRGMSEGMNLLRQKQLLRTRTVELILFLVGNPF